MARRRVRAGPICPGGRKHGERRPVSFRGTRRLSPADKDKLLLSMAGLIARERHARGVKLNHPETVALLSCWVIEGARAGRSVADLREAGRHVLGRDDVMEGIPEMVAEVQVEATFPDGRKLVTLHEPTARFPARWAPPA